ncbi:MAG: signal peptidase I [Candidatus Nanoarchaeia archaeon]|nr:signal peptidase I [Candidatus Nanoarchaeia archaeon]
MKTKSFLFFISLLFAGIFLIAYSLNVSGEDTSYTLLAPSDTLSEANILVYDSKVIITLDGARWASYTNTKSMLPVLDEGSHGIEIVPKSIEDIHIGDIVAYETKYNRIPIVHRVIAIKKDSLGTYFVLKGDNNQKADGEKVRFSQIKYKLVAVIY